MSIPHVFERIITPGLAAVAVGLLLAAGCQSASDEPAMDQVEELPSPPDPHVPQGENLERPEGWMVRLDKPDPTAVIGSADTADVFFVNMTPGWHITTHKSGIFYHPASTAEGDFAAHADIYFFDPGDRQREGHGMFFGGKNLDSDSLSYGYFLLRNTGEFLIKKRSGAETEVVQDWTSSEAVNTVEQGSEESVLNELSVRVEGDQVHFILNGENVATHPASSVPTQGIVGLRMNHGTNVHIADLNVEQ